MDFDTTYIVCVSIYLSEYAYCIMHLIKFNS